MPSESGDRRVVRGVAQLSVTEKKEQEQLECPRCESKNTKFCYYNNYNLSQPRHFCKSCRRYWTHGGTLRDVPVGGSTRSSSSSKPTKRSRSSSTTTKTTISPPVLSPPLPPPASGTEFLATHIPTSGTDSLGSFTSLLASSSAGFLGLLEPVPNRSGPVLGFDGLGFELGLGRGGSMSLPEVGDMASVNTWHLGIGDGLGDVDCSFPWPDLAISTPASASGLQ